MTATQPDPRRPAEGEWMYAGVVMLTDGTAGGEWRPLSGDLAADGPVFKIRGAAAYVVGGVYLATIGPPDGEPGGTVKWWGGEAAYAGRRLADAELPGDLTVGKLQAASRAAQVRIAGLKRHKADKAKSTDRLDDALVPLLALVQGLHKSADLEAVMAYVQRSVVEAWHARKAGGYVLHDMGRR